MYIFKWLVAGAGPDFSRANFCFGGEASKPRGVRESRHAGQELKTQPMDRLSCRGQFTCEEAQTPSAQGAYLHAKDGAKRQWEEKEAGTEQKVMEKRAC